MLASLPRGEPLSTAALQARGLSAFRASTLARSGWLVHLARGVHMPPGDPRLLVSVPERAMLELLSDVGKVHSLTETRELVENYIDTVRAN